MFSFILISCNGEELHTEQENESFLVDVTTATKTTLTETLNLTGQALPSKQVPVFTQAPLEIITVHTQIGETVKKGDPIIALQSEEANLQLNRARAAVTEIEGALEQANRVNAMAQRSVRELETLQSDMQSTVNRTYELMEQIGDSNLDKTLLPLLQQSLELTIKQAELTQAANVMMQLPTVNTTELEIQLASAKENVKQAERFVESTTIRSPVDGIIGQLDVVVGQTAIPNTPLATVVVLDPIMATFTANPFQVVQLEQQLEATITVDGLSEEYQSQISTVSPTVDPTLQSFFIEVPLENKDARIKGGMKLQGRFEVGSTEEAIAIPADAIFYEENTPYIFLVNNNKAKKQKIKTGTRSETLIEVVEGVELNDKIITTGKEQLSDESEITIRKSESIQ